MIYVTGDMHGDLTRLKAPKARKIRRGDSLIVCGDFGFVWDASQTEINCLKWLSNRDYDILFVEGAHENYELLVKYPIVDFKGGKARQISKNIYQLLRGYVFTIEEKKVFAFGGGDDETMDLYDLPETPDFKRLPSDEECSAALSNLEKCGNEVDYFVTYDVGFKMRSLLMLDSNIFNSLHTFLEQAGKQCKAQKWFFGRYHMDRIIPPRYYGVYSGIYDAQTGKQL